MPHGQFKIWQCHFAGMQAVEAQTRHTFSRHTHEQFGIGVIYRGAQKSHSGQGMVEAGPGDAITVNPGEVHDGTPIGDAGRSWKILYIDPALVAEAAGDISESRTGEYEFVRPVIRNARLAACVQVLFSIMTGSSAAQTSIRQDELLLTVLADAMRGQHATGDETPVPQGIAVARSRIDDDPVGPLTLVDLARESGLSRFQVVRGFTRATGFTPHAYLVQRRIDIARQLIARGVPLAEAAAASGFADQSHMTRIFVRKYGISPGAYADAVN